MKLRFCSINYKITLFIKERRLMKSVQGVGNGVGNIDEIFKSVCAVLESKS